LQIWFGFDGPHYSGSGCISLHGRMQAVRRGSQQSAVTAVSCGIPQESVFGPTEFILYTPYLEKLIERHGLNPHLYAYDTQF
jgi:hypothetical protein